MPAAEVWAELLGQGGLSQMGQTLLDTQLRSQLAALSNPREKWSLESESQAQDARACFSLKRAFWDSGGLWGRKGTFDSTLRGAT